MPRHCQNEQGQLGRWSLGRRKRGDYSLGCPHRYGGSNGENNEDTLFGRPTKLRCTAPKKSLVKSCTSPDGVEKREESGGSRWSLEVSKVAKNKRGLEFDRLAWPVTISDGDGNHGRLGFGAVKFCG